MLKRNLFANCAQAAVLGIPILLVYPYYSSEIGSNLWGIAAQCLTLYGLALISDLGLSQFVPSEIAKLESSAQHQLRRFHQFKKLYGAVAIAVLLPTLLWTIVRIHIKVETAGNSYLDELYNLSPYVIVFIAAALSLTNAANIGYLYGTGRHHFVAYSKAANVTTSAVLGVSLAKVGIHGPSEFAACLLTGVLIEYIVCLFIVNNIISNSGGIESGSFMSSELIGQAYSALRLSGAIAIGALCSQLDRIFQLLNLPDAQYGQYLLVATFAGVAYQLQYPIARSFLPRISAAFAGDRTVELKSLKLKLLLATLGLCTLPCFLSPIFAEHLLEVWKSDAQFTLSAKIPFCIMLFSIGINSIYSSVFYVDFIVMNCFDIIFRVNLTSLSVSLIYYVVCSMILEPSLVIGALGCLIAAIVQIMTGGLLRQKIQPKLLLTHRNVRE